MRRTPTCLLAASLVILIAATGPAPAFAHENEAPIGEAIRDVPLFDTHMHYKEPAWGPYPVESVIELMDRNGVAMALVSSTPDEGTIMLWEHAPNRIVPELRPYHGNAGSSNWTKAEGDLPPLTGPFRMLVHHSFDLHRDDAFGCWWPVSEG